jgi:predicted GNAT superfamily acetyltransferase
MARITRALGKKREKREETKQMSLRVPTDLSDLFDRYAEEDEVSVTQIGLDAFQQYIGSGTARPGSSKRP